MSKIDELIADLCPEGVEYRPLERCCKILDNKRKPVTKAAREAGEYPYYGANGIQDYVSDYIFNGTFVLVGEDGSVITKSGTPVVTWAKGKIWVNNHAHIIEEIDDVLLRYLYHFIQIINVSPLIHGNIPKLTGGDFRALSIPIPPLPIQEEIIRILDQFTTLEAELEAELEARKKQYEYYRDELFAIKDSVEWKPLGEVAKISNGKDHKGLADGDIPVYGSGGVMRYANEYIYDQESVLIPRKGSIGNIFYIDIPFWTVDTIFYTKINCEQIKPKYLYYFLKTQHLEELNTAGGVPSLTKSILDKVLIPVPPIEEQKRIVAILDRFDALVNDITQGLPAEIAARRKQYEYYRDKLLTFQEKVS